MQLLGLLVIPIVVEITTYTRMIGSNIDVTCMCVYEIELHVHVFKVHV